MLEGSGEQCGGSAAGQQEKKRLPRRRRKKIASEEQLQNPSSDAMGYYWLLQLKKDACCMLPQSCAKKMSWLDLLCQKNMGTKGLVSFYDDSVKTSGCFCVLKTARTQEGMAAKLGHFCTAEKLNSSFPYEHALYLSYGRRGLLCMEQKGIPDVLADMQVADKPPPIVLEGAHCSSSSSSGEDDDSPEASDRKKHRRSFACQASHTCILDLQHTFFWEGDRAVFCMHRST